MSTADAPSGVTVKLRTAAITWSNSRAFNVAVWIEIFLLEMVDDAGDRCRTKTIVDIYDGHPRRTAV